MYQELNTIKPSIDKQIDYVRTIRHLSFKKKIRFIVEKSNNELLMAIEETLIAAKLMTATIGQARPIPEYVPPGLKDPEFGRINMYSCKFGHRTISVDRCEGVTPFIISCPQCEEEGHEVEAASQFYRVVQSLIPSHEFYKPNEEELADMKADLAPHIYESIAAHVAQDGLLFRKIREVSHA